MIESATEPSVEAPEWVFARVPRGRRDVVLDVGAGRHARGLAGDVRQVIALGGDAAELEQRRRDGAAAGIENILYLRGETASLPFLDASFRVVLCGFALHHFPEPHVQLIEIKRVLQPRGWLALADMVVSEDLALAERQNRIEHLRDPLHSRALSASALQDTVVRLGYEVAGAETHVVRRPLDAWLGDAGTPPAAAEEIRTSLAAEAGGGAATGLAPEFADDGGLSIAHTLTSLLVLNRDA